MSIEKTCLEHLVPHLKAIQLECKAPEGPVLAVPGLALDVVALEGQIRPTSVQVVFDARPQGTNEPGFRVLAIGLGDGEDAAAADAAAQWATGVLPVLRSWLLHGHVCEVEHAPMVVALPDSPERFGWTVHLGPVLGRAYGRTGPTEPGLGDLSRFAAYEPLFHVLHRYAAHRKLMWVESFACRYFADKKVDATCRLNNREIDDGREALVAWASTWPETGAELLSKRQFLLFESVPMETVDPDGHLRLRLEREVAKDGRPWWRRILGGAS